MKTFTVTVPTYKREKDLGECLESIITQSLQPTELLVVDDDALPAAYIEGWKKRFTERGVSFVYYRKDHAVERRGLSESKNAAIRTAKGEIIFFFDDDLVLHAGFLEAVMAVWNSAGDERLLAVGGLVDNMRRSVPLERAYNRLFGMSSETAWDINEVGYQVWDRDITKVTKGYYVLGGVSSYRRAELAKLRFATFSGGRTELEDVDLCFKAKRGGYHMMLVPQARVFHKESPAGREAAFTIGTKLAYNRRQTYDKYGLKSAKGRLWFAWANAGWLLRQVLILHWAEAAGGLVGFLKRRPSDG